MSASINVSTLNAWLPLVSAAVGGLAVIRKFGRWFDSVDDRFADAEKREQGRDERLATIEAELKPDHGKSHHDVIIKEVRRAVKDIVEDQGSHRRRRVGR